MNKRKIICVVGATSSGKTALAVSLAKKFNGEIISADSRQIYRGLDIGTGKDLSEYGNVKYHAIDICSPEEKFSVFDWLKVARRAIDEITARSRVPIVAGGTGLYIQALIEGFTQIQKTNAENEGGKKKKYPREELNKMPLEKLREIYFELQKKEPNLDLNNPRRLIRAIEREREGSRFGKKKPGFEALQIAVALPRLALYRKIDGRVDRRFEEGMLEEVAGLLASGVSARWLDDLGLEYRIVSRYITENIKNQKLNIKDLVGGAESGGQRLKREKIFQTKEFEQMSQELKWKTHAFARRQLTWLRRFPQIKWVKSEREAEKLVKRFLAG